MEKGITLTRENVKELLKNKQIVVEALNLELFLQDSGSYVNFRIVEK